MLLLFKVLVILARRHASYLAPQPGMEPWLPASEGKSSNHWTHSDVPVHFLKCLFFRLLWVFWGPRISGLRGGLQDL